MENGQVSDIAGVSVGPPGKVLPPSPFASFSHIGIDRIEIPPTRWVPRFWLPTNPFCNPKQMLFDSLSPFTLLNLGWITHLLANVKETPTYDFIVIGGGNAYVSSFFAHGFLLVIWRIKGVWQLQVVLLKILQSPSLYWKQARMLNIFQRYLIP